MHTLRPVANGLRTDHPIEGLPFVADDLLDLDDPLAIEKIGRKVADDMWGRWDKARRSGGWVAFTTHPARRDLAWSVRHHPEHGTSVLLMRDTDASPMHLEWWGDALLFRAGGYWWDGTTWYRPGQVWDAASEEFARRPVTAATTLTAADLLGPDPAAAETARVLDIAEVDIDAPAPERWSDHLALWAQHRDAQARPLKQCVVSLTAPELVGDRLIGVPEMAELGGISASTLRAYISRRESDVPPPQSTTGGRNMWSRAVGEDWAEHRRRTTSAAAGALATSDDDDLPSGMTELKTRFTARFFNALWERPDRRKRWALRHRTETAVGQVADGLGWTVVDELGDIIPTGALATTIRYAVLYEITTGMELHRETSGPDEDPVFFGLVPDVAKMLDWLIRHHPDHAKYIIGDIVGDAERRLDVPRDVTAQTLRTALGLDGEMGESVYRDYLERVLPPAN